MSNLVNHAKGELARAGLYSKESDYGGMLGHAVEELVTVFAAQGHSGYSAHLAIDLFRRVAGFKRLAPLTSDPAEWMVVGADNTWQSVRQSSCFSSDVGRTYYDVDERQAWWRRALPRRAPLRWRLKHHRSAPPHPEALS